MSSYTWSPLMSGGVTSIDGMTGALTLVAGTGITIVDGPGTITISSTALMSAITSINADTTAAQTLSVGTSGSDFAIVDAGGGSHVFNLPTASASNRGALSSTDWSTFNNKQNALTFGNLTDVGTDGIIITGGTGAVIGSGTSIAQHVADTTHNGYLSSTDWATFNNKANATLNNLAATTTANNSISPQLNNTYDLGSDSFNWLALHAHYAEDASGNISIDFHNRLLKNSSVTVLDFSGTDLSVNTRKITSLSNPTSNQDAATKIYVDNAVSGANAISALTGDVTATGPGSVAATLATVNSNTGTFGSSTSIPTFTVNGKGLITAASGNAVIAPASTLTGTTLASNVVTSSLTSLGIQAQALDMGSHLINNVTDPASPQDAATKAYVDSTAVTLTVFGSTPNNNGGSLSVQALTLQPADGTHPGGVSTTTQTFGGSKIFAVAPAITDTSAAHNVILSAASSVALTADRTLTIDTANVSSTLKMGANLTVSGAATVSGTNTGDQTITLTGDVTGSGTGSFATTAAATQSNITSVPNLATVGTVTSGTWSATTIAVNKGGTGQTSYTDGQLLIGNTSGNTLTKATLTAGTGITVTNGNGSITIASSGSSAPAYNYTSQTTTYSAVANDYIKCSSTAFTITLPTAVGVSGQRIAVQHDGGQLTAYTINTTSSQTINNGEYASGAIKLQTINEVFVFVSNNVGWLIEHHYVNSNWTATAPTFTGLGTVASNSAFYRRIGNTLEVNGSVTAGTVAAAIASISLPGSLAIDNTVLSLANTTAAQGNFAGKYAGNGTNRDGHIVTATGTSTTLVYFGGTINATGSSTPQNGNAILSTGQTIVYSFTIPISGWIP